MRIKIFILFLIVYLGKYGCAQQNPIVYDTFPIAAEHFANEFDLYAVVPRIHAGIHLEQGLGPCKVYVQINAHIDIKEDGTLPDHQNNSSKITIWAIKDIESGMYLYEIKNEPNDAMTAFLDLLNCYYQNKFANVHYVLSGKHAIPSDIIYFYVENIQ
jgi:hypothetical protein